LNYSNYCDCGINLGDITEGYASNSDGTWYTNLVNSSTKRIYTILGNHDVWHESSYDEGFLKWIEPTKNTIGITDLSTPYYYKDYSNYNIRLIFLNNYDHPTDITFD